ncbi:hypothetical protein [Amycolatopsis australiensis]|uniref:Uncharacterized protein n=1 Tax=Amycolatopsis australiensis TaxID=546364 RepID=A0A1K1RMP2_9PSEU|nr:hypothetical protein [Amycolatopsis australiensis]SFW73109.1 hypothetical protein SAMN04489730_3560 [Amycolatopsis australiensis]
MTELMALTKSRGRAHHSNPISEWWFDAVEVRQPAGDADHLRPDKPGHQAVGKAIERRADGRDDDHPLAQAGAEARSLRRMVVR